MAKIQSEERLVATSGLNLAPNSVTNCREAKGKGYRAATKVKGLGPEINHYLGGQYGSYSSRQNSYVCNGQGYEIPTGSKTVARYQKDNIGTWEIHSVLQNRVCDDKLINGKLLQETLWESDWCIVAKKQGNACGAKALAKGLLGERNFC
ncbi:MAG: hypothetical protein DRP84_08810 [Spirochaetes bacterium]|nr:MAG: hypothetical protein DRP84_08810 [Spirochaetota bacterium]